MQRHTVIVGVAIGYRAKSGWITEGWWIVEGSTCKTLVEGPLASRYYYLFAEDAERGALWEGPVKMCIAEKEFKIAGTNDCFARGYQRAGFQEYDTGQQSSWMVQLTDGPQTGAVTPSGNTQSMRRNRKVKILATVGPASSEEHMLRALFEAGADVFRINMSHSSHELMRELVRRIRAVEEAVKRPIGILCDLQGPKLRVGKFENVKVELKEGQSFTLDDDPTPGNATRVHLPHPEILQSVEPGHRLLIDDGKLSLLAEASDGKSIRCKVISGTSISDKKGVSLPDTTLPVGALTDKDRADLDACLAENVDWIALSFVQRPEDVAEVRKIAAGRAAVMSKLEKPQAIERLGRNHRNLRRSHGRARRSGC